MAEGSWLERQNSAEAISARAASDHYWDVVQRLRAAEFFIFVLIPTAIAIVAQFIHAMDTTAAIVGFAMTIVDAGIAYPWIAMARRRAAQAQDGFDAFALWLPHSRVRQIGGPDTVEIQEAAGFQSKKRAKRNLNWYTPRLGTLPIEIGRIACMRETTSWDGGLRSRYVWSISGTIVVVVLAFFAYGVAGHLTIEEFLVRILFPLTPAILWVGREIWDNREASQTVNRLREALADLWLDAIRGRLSQETLNAQTVDLDSAIFAYRQSTPPVPDAFYGLFRSRTEVTMDRVARDLIAEYYRERPS
jgi:hypothetical protein